IGKPRLEPLGECFLAKLNARHALDYAYIGHRWFPVRPVYLTNQCIKRHDQRGEHGIEAHRDTCECAGDLIDRKGTRGAEAMGGKTGGEAAGGIVLDAQCVHERRDVMAPTRPVQITRTAVSDGSPPSCSAIPIAMPAVTDLGAKEASTTVGES